MTTAPDSSDGAPSRLDAQTTALVREALRRYLGEGGNTAALREAMATMTAEARARGILAERLVVMLKDMWSGLPEVRSMHDAADRVRLQQHIVTLCIREYFST